MLASSNVSTILPVKAKRAEAIMPVDAIPLLEELGPLSSLTKSALAGIAKLVRCTGTGLHAELHHILTFT